MLMNLIFFTWGEIGLVGKFRNESVASIVLLPTADDVGCVNSRKLSIARRVLVYTIYTQSWWWADR